MKILITKKVVLFMLLLVVGLTLILVPSCSSGGNENETYDYKIELYSGGVLVKTHNYKDAHLRIFDNWVKITLQDENVIYLRGDMEVNRTTTIKKIKSNNIDY